MGRDKAGLPFGPGNLLGHMLGTLREAGFEAEVAGLPAGAPAPACTRCIYDRYPAAGPLAGIEAALHSLAGEQPQPVLFVPVDLPLLPPVFLQLLWSRAAHTGAWATVPFALGRPQPLCAVYSSSLADGFAQALTGGHRKMMSVVQALAAGSHFDALPVEALAPLHGWTGTHRWFTNLNTPADWNALAFAGSGAEACASTGEGADTA